MLGCPNNDRTDKKIRHDSKFQETWKTKGNPDLISKHLKKAEAVARFCLTTEHDFLGVYLNCLGQAADEPCPLCGHARMDDDHLLQCTELDEYPTDDVARWHWETQRQLVKINK
ncbi:reverse transcriptase [Trichonephila clavipes]|nr:reverse transcriptase [Trichonephila clavipes]